MRSPSQPENKDLTPFGEQVLPRKKEAKRNHDKQQYRYGEQQKDCQTLLQALDPDPDHDLTP
jgi:hypothetical protein